jgi:hypothetical protein
MTALLQRRKCASALRHAQRVFVVMQWQSVARTLRL